MYSELETESVGNPYLDADHRVFKTICSQLSNAEIHTHDSLNTSSTLSQLKDYLLGHFYREESALRLAQFPDLEAHIKEHVRFEVTIRTLISRHEAGDFTAIGVLTMAAIAWERSHHQLDLAYGRWLVNVEVDKRSLYELAYEATMARRSGNR